VSKRAHPTLIGAFVLGAIVLTLAAVFLLAGGSARWQKKQTYIMYFEGSVYGLQVGAPVVFRGVKIGAVKTIGIAFDRQENSFFIPVTVEMGSPPATDLTGNGRQTIDISDLKAQQDFIARGLRGQLAIQSILTGMLYISLDFHPGTPAERHAKDQTIPEIPTIPTTVQKVQQRLENIDFEKLFNDVATIATVVREKAQSKELDESLADFRRAMRSLAMVSARLEKQSGPLLSDSHKTIRDAQRALAEARTAMVSTQTATKDVSGAAKALGQVASDDSPTVLELKRTLQEATLAARALRRLADTLEQQPEALLQGKRTGEQ